MVARWAPALTTALLAAAVYANTTGNQPALDDGWVIFDNPSIRSLSSLPRIFREAYNAAGFETTGGLYRPVTTATYALNYAAGGAQVTGYHLVNLGLHVLCTLLVLALCAHLARSAGPEGGNREATRIAWLAAALYAVHPAHVEAVTMLAGRAELLAALFSLSCLYLVCTRARAPWRWPLGAACLALGVLSKESAGVTPLLFALVAWLVPQAAGLDPKRRLRSFLAVELSLLAAVCAYLALKLAGPGGLGIPPVAQYFQGAPGSVVALTMTRVLTEYLRILVWPHPLGLDFHYRLVVPLTSHLGGPAAWATLAWTSTLAAALLLRKRAPLAGLGVCWLFVALLPVSNLVPIGAHLAERFLYLPSAGFALAAAVGAVRLPALFGPALRARASGWRDAAVVFALAALALLTWQRNRDWRTPLALWQAEHALAPDDPVVNLSLASAYDALGDFQTGRAYAERAVRLAPSNWAAQVNLGLAAQGLHDDAAAERAFRTAHDLAPRVASPLFFLGELSLSQGRLEAAQQLLAEAEKASPEDAAAARQHGTALYLLGQPERAREQWAHALRLDPAEPLAHGYLALLALRSAGDDGASLAATPDAVSLSGLTFQWGEWLARAGRWPEALAHHRLALRLFPGHSRALVEMARSQERLGDFGAARDSLRRALEISPGFEEARQTLARLSAPAEPPATREAGSAR